MTYSFEDLGTSPELVEALASEGLEEPGEFQRAAIPVLRRGNNLLGGVGPGSGTLVSYGVPLLERTEVGTGRPGAVILTATPEAATALAESLGRIAVSTGHVVASLGGTWACPGRADLLFGTPRHIREAVDASRLTLEAVRCVVVDGASAIEAASGLDSVGALFDYLGHGTQRVVLSLPITEAVAALVSRHVPKAVQVPPRTAAGGSAGPPRGVIHFRVTPGDKVEALMALVAELLSAGAPNVLMFCRSEDRAADVADFLALHGYMVGAPADEAYPLWLSAASLESHRALESVDSPDQVPTVSLDCPIDVATLNRRHGAGGRATVLLHAREVPHFRDTARRAGYPVQALPPPPSRVEDRIDRIRQRLTEVAKRDDLAPHFLVLEPLLERFSPQELAAAALSLLSRPPLPDATTTHPASQARAERATGSSGWTRLFVSIGERDGTKPGSLRAILADQSGVDGSRFGRIDMRDTYSLVEVRPSEAVKVIKAVNGVTIRGRSTRVDYDRGRGRSGGGPRRHRGGRTHLHGSEDPRGRR